MTEVETVVLQPKMIGLEISIATAARIISIASSLMLLLLCEIKKNKKLN